MLYSALDFKYYWGLFSVDSKINTLFDRCVAVLIDAARYTNTTYELVNIVLFVILMPIVILVQMLLNILLIYRVTSLQNA